MLTRTTSVHQTPNAGDRSAHINEMDMMTILELEVQNIKMARDSEEQKQNMNRLLLKEPKWTESAINPQCMINDIGPPTVCDSTSSWHDETLKSLRNK